MRGKTLTAQEGFVYTDGAHFGRIIHLRQDDDGSGWYEVKEDNAGLPALAAAEDYQAALAVFGVSI